MFKQMAIANSLTWSKIALMGILSLTYPSSVSSETSDRASNSSLAKPTPASTLMEIEKSCPHDIANLTTLLIEDIPDYSNRVLKRTQNIHQDAGIDTYIVTAGQPELEPLNLPQIDYGSTTPETTKQIFFTTLERQYNNRKKIERQTYHWLFVTMTDSGWHLVTMYSRFGHATKNTPPTPPIESSNGIIGQAASLWLRDCRESFTLQ